MRRLPVRVALTGFLVVLAASGSPQQTPPAPPTFGAGTEVVLLDLVARDGKGRPIADLRPDELQVLEDGKAAQIVSFHAVHSGPTRPPAPGSTASPASPPQAAEGGASQANLVVLVFDAVPVASAALARDGALQLLQQRFPENTWFAVYKIGRTARLLQPFTSDPSRLASAVRAATSGDDARREATAQAELQSFAPEPATVDQGEAQQRPPAARLQEIGKAVAVQMQELVRRGEAFDSFHALLAIARGMAPVRARKSILYFAENRQAPAAVLAAYDTAVSAANRGNVTIHTVDVRGLSAHGAALRNPLDETARGSFDSVVDRFDATAGSRAADVRTQPWTVDTATTDTGVDAGRRKALGESTDAAVDRLNGPLLENVAHDTGGLAIADTNDLGAGLAAVVEDLGQYYEIAYAPPDPRPDGRFRHINVKVSRPGVRLRTRSGYFATPAAGSTLVAYELPLLSALGSREVPSEFPHSAGVLHFAARGREREAVFLAKVPVSELQVSADPAGGVWRAHLQLVGLLKDESGRAVARITHDWPLEGPARDMSHTRELTAVFRRNLSLPPGLYSLETAVQDADAKRISVRRGRFEIPPAEPGLALGSLSVVASAAASSSAATADPLQVSSVNVQPELDTPVFEPSRREIPLFLPIYASAAVPVELELQVWRGGEVIATTKPALPAPDLDGRIPWVGALSTKSVPPGRYELVATVRQGAQTAEERTIFELRAPEGAPERSAAAAHRPATGPPVPPDLVPVLERAAQYVLEYGEKFRDIVAEESYTQWTGRESSGQAGAFAGVRGTASSTMTCFETGCRRITRADIVFVRLAGAIPWGTFRDVFEVDGNRLRDEHRLEKIFTGSPSADALARARTLLDESARYNVGEAVRNINFPTLSLAFLHPRNQARFAWKRGGKRRFGNVLALELDFEEVVRPTLIDQDGKGDLPAKGRFWVDPARGTVIRSETRLTFEPARAQAYVATEYRPEPTLAMWVPSEMREEYRDLPGPWPVFLFPSEATARYSRFRRFSVTTEETARVPEK